jgi:hypothetical protein
MAYTKACPSLDLQTRPRFRPVSLSLSMVECNNALCRYAECRYVLSVVAPFYSLSRSLRENLGFRGNSTKCNFIQNYLA